ncbi:MAG: GMC family oxidoreductase [Pseudomonadota bacterium]
MLQDFHTASEDALSGRFDVCVAGTGPAGISVARKVAARGGRVLLLEAGGMTPTAESRDVLKGQSVGTVNYQHIEKCRLRYFGGTSGHWAGRCALFDPIDFEDRAIFGMPGWPISYDECYSHLSEACAILDIEEAAVTTPATALWSNNRMRAASFTRSTPTTRFGPKYRAEIEESGKITCLYNANVTALTLDEAGTRIISADVKGYDGSARTINADRFVIAFGAMENARFLLNVNQQMPSGLGNQTDWVGRTFMEHFNIELGMFVPTDTSFWERFVQTEGKAKGRGFPLMPGFDAMRSAGLGNATLSMRPATSVRFNGRLGPLRKVQRDLTCSIDPLRAYAQSNDSSISCPGDWITGNIMEHLPNRDSRVTVDPNARDAFGQPRLQLAYEVSDADKKTMRSLAIEMAKAFAETDVARMRISDDVLQGTANVGAHCHHMGTTRMASSAAYGVVDPNCRVFGVDNLYMGGSSVFSTGGGVNPTLTLVALALRLGDHIGDQMTSG